MPDWESLRHLAALARAQTVAGAARALGVEHATVSRRIASLERELDLKLLDRRGRKIELTSHGRELIASLERMQSEADAIERLAAGRRTTLSGEVTITAPPALGTAMLAPALVELRDLHPGLMLHIVAETRQSELQRREADLAIRLTAPADPDLLATKLGEVSFRLYARASYLAAFPKAEWIFVGYEASMDRSPQQLAMLHIAGDRPIAIRANSVELQLNVVAEGGGVAMLPDFLVQNKQLLPAGEKSVRREAWLVIHSDMAASGPVKAVAEVLEKHLRRRLGG
jgi:DNA-binding transcriptional LysR family regulator